MNTRRLKTSTENLRADLVGWLRVFSIHGRWIFPLLVGGLALLSVSAWWSVQSLIENDQRSRLDAEGARIETSIRERLSTFGNSLVHIRGDFIVDGVPSQETFRRFIGTLQVSQRLSGLDSFGYASFVNPNEAAITLIEPSDLAHQSALNFNVLQDPIGRRALHDSIRTGDPIMTGPLALPSERLDRNSPAGFMIFLALGKSPTGEALEDMQGALFASFHAADFFEGILGEPSLDRESVNFSMEIREDETSQPLYNRFDLSSRSSISSVRKASFLGRDVYIRVTPLAHFFKTSESYLPMLVGIGAAFISILILLVLKASQTQLEYETHAKETSLRAVIRSRSQSELLNRLNKFARDVSAELDLDELIKKIGDLAPKLISTDGAFFYCAHEGDCSPQISLVSSTGFAAEDIRHSTLTSQEMHAFVPNRFLMQKGDPDAQATFTALLKTEDRFSSWILAGIPCRETGRCGLIFLARDANGAPFDGLELEVFESFVSQAATAMENARLFRRSQEAGLAKSSFLANMSHEIRTPLNAIVGYTEILLKDPTRSQKASLAHSIRRGSQQLTGIIDDILDLSKLESGHLVIDRKRVRLSHLLQEIRAIMELRALEKCLTFTIDSTGIIPSHIETDEVRLKQVLANLVGNAIKFCEKGSVSLHVRYSKEDNQVLFRIKDTGIGIPTEAQSRLFGLFSQADDSKTRRFGGSGLGLALSRRLCEELGGDLDLLESYPGEGSTFEAKIKAGAITDVTWLENIFQALPEDQRATKPAQSGRLNGAKILMVEDSVDNQEIFRFFLESAGAEIEIVDNGLDGVAYAIKNSYDMILMDIQIPKIDGKEATRRIRRAGFTKPIVALTAHALVEERVSCIQAGCDGQITKPVSGDMLVTKFLVT